MKHILTAALNRITANLHDMIRDFFRVNPNPTDDEVHAFAATLGMSPEALEKHIYELFTECNDRQAAAVVAGVRRRGQPAKGRIALAYLFAFPVAQAPDEAFCSLLARLQKMCSCSVHFVLSDKLLPGNSVFEVHSADSQTTTNTLINALQNYGWRCTQGRTADTIRVQKSGKLFTLIFVQTT